VKLNTASTSSFVAIAGELISWSNTTVITSPLPMPSWLPLSDALQLTITGAECACHVPASTPVDVDTGDDSSALCRAYAAFTVKRSTPTRVNSCAASFAMSTMVIFTVVYDVHTAV
jgi:hypothetical protein